MKQLEMFEYWGERDMTPMEMVQQFQRVSGQEPDPALYRDLVHEEFFEWDTEWRSITKAPQLKELADLVYVIYGYANSRGWDLDEALKRVHANNMGRMYQPDGTIQRREDGKIVKNKDYPKVRLEDLV